jgi:glutathione synthase/RimK-type ligase-like ATP-grasp enzyme
MILLCGIPSEKPMRLVRERLEALGAPAVMFNQREFARSELGFEMSGGRVIGELRIGERVYRLEEFQAVYTRLMDDRSLPELTKEPPDSARRIHCRSLHETLIRWCEIAHGRIVNRSAPAASNSSKPYQAQLVREIGFSVPETLITNDPNLVREFISRHPRVVYKSISAVRSIVQTFEEADFERLENIRWCPTQFQAFVEGTNLRVHTIGQEVFGTAITTKATDYRYAARQCGDHADLRPVDLAEEVAMKCLELSRALGLDFAGIDLKVTPDDEVYCFEVNPCPGFSYYESNTGQPISDAVARYLAHEI